MTFTWKALLLTLLLMGVVAQEPDEYPAGSFCTPKGDVVNHLQTPDHPCHCAKMYDRQPNDPYCETSPVRESRDCKQWCHSDHCGCPVDCPMQEPTPEEPQQR